MDIKFDVLKAFRKPLYESKAHDKVLYGGSGSGKTHAVQQYALVKAMSEPGKHTLVIMETIAGVKTSMLYPMMRMLEDRNVRYKSYESIPINLELFNGHVIWFASADKSEKLKHFDNIHRVIVNEATAITRDKYNQMMNRVGRTTADAEHVFTFNPIDAHHWLVEEYVDPYLNKDLPDGVVVHHSTFKDNTFLSQSWIDKLHRIGSKDPNFYRVYVLGEPGVLEGLIYKEGAHWVHSDHWGWGFSMNKVQPVAVGVDWGFKDACAIIAFWDNPRGRYVHQFVYKSGMTPVDVADTLDSLFGATQWSKHMNIFCDPSRPENILLLNKRGYSHAQKAINDIQFGIGMVMDKTFIVSDDSQDLIQELRNYRWAEKNGETTQVPVDEFNHACDAMRYAIASATARPATDPNRFFAMGRRYGP